MKLKILLWVLGLLLKRAFKRDPEFRAELEKRPLDWGVATEDMSIARHYRMSHAGVTTGSGLPVDTELELRFADSDSAVTFLLKPSPRAFLQGLMDQRVRLVGDSAQLNRLQSLLKRIR
ncbi:hypothetical protein U0O11_17270 [Cobetia sp. D5]|uniref:hypothetical protein n=1 Tax=Cobetia sp. D5 TaxID=3105867 RepID=UPI002D787FFB|nr:hypothetical protein [Cobetia sp. D5]